jgi:DNA-binding beta-propeller fold protein YncE
MRRLSLLAAVAVLTGCGTGSQPNLAQAEPLARLLGPYAANVMRDGRARSWFARSAAAQALLYVSDPQGNRVAVYSFPYGKAVGVLRGLDSPAGECVDNAQNVWITETYASELVEYAHGGTKRIAKLADTGQYPLDCSVDPITGNLAVTNAENSGGGQGSIAIYAGASGPPRVYSYSKLYYPFFLGYDDASNHFIDGEGPRGGFVFGELPAGSHTFTKISLHKAFELAGGVLWDGAYVTVGDEGAGVVYQTTGAGGRIVGTTQLSGAQNVAQFWIPKLGDGSKKQQGSKLVGPNLNGESVMFWKYPSGGTAIRTLDGPDAPFGTAISKPLAKR